MLGDDILHFESMKNELKKNDIFLTIDSGKGGTIGSFIVCENKHAKRWASLIICDDSSVIGLFNYLSEVRAFALGLRVGQNKPWKG